MEGKRLHQAGSQQFAVGNGQFPRQYSAHLMRGGKESRTPAGVLAVREWSGMPTPEVGDLAVTGKHQRKGVAGAMLARAVEDHPNLSHSRSAMTLDGGLAAMNTPLPGDDEAVARRIASATKPVWSAANTMLGGPGGR